LFGELVEDRVERRGGVGIAVGGLVMAAMSGS
jgi:hypothetical protein